ncbi:MAG: tetratricopeptide repeat protein [Peptococcaceae bacterium]|nr:MAG: tetratricopeptide repeat protein [Peptococcaceae bacterium]
MAKAVSKKVQSEPVRKAAVSLAENYLTQQLAFWGLALLLFFPPYFRGLFFPAEQETALIFAAFIFWLAWFWKWLRQDKSFLSHPLDYFVFAFPVVYMVSAVQAVNYGLAINEVVKTLLYFLVYWLVSRLIREEKELIAILHAIYLSAVGVALAGLTTATNIITIRDGFLDGRIYSSFQYPNALASYLAAATFLGIYFWWRSGAWQFPAGKNPLWKNAPAWLRNFNPYRYLYALANFFLFAVFLGTKSNGGFLVFAVVLILYFIGMPRGSRLPSGIHFAFLAVPSVLAIWRFLAEVGAGRMGLAWLWALIGLAMIILGQLFYNFLERKNLFAWIEKNKKVIFAGISVVLVVISAGMVFYLVTHGGALKEITGEIRLRNATERLYFFKDAVRMFVARPILGWGGGGWQEAYHAYQSYLYSSTQVHGHYFQVAVETGMAGLLVIIGIWVSFLWAAHRAYRSTGESLSRRTLVWIITVAALAIGLHASIDFDLSLSALTLVLWTMFGLVRVIPAISLHGEDSGAGFGGTLPGNKKSIPKKKSPKKYVPPDHTGLIGATIASLAVILFAGALVLAGNNARQAGEYFQQKKYNLGLKSLQKAARLNPADADYHSNLARIYYQAGKYDLSLAEAQEAVKRSKYNPQQYNSLSALYYNNKKRGEAMASAEKAVALAPFQVKWYEGLARTADMAGIAALEAGDPVEAQGYFQQVIGVPERLTKKMDSLSAEEKQLWNVAPLMSVTPSIQLNMGIARYFLGSWPEAEADLQAAGQDKDSSGEALLWLSILRNKQGRAEEAKDLLNQADALTPGLKSDYERLKKLPVLN